MLTVERLALWVQRTQLFLASSALMVMMIGTVLDVFFRYTFNRPLRISYDLVESMLVVFVFNGISSVFLQRRNIVIDIIDGFAGPRITRGLIAAGNVLSLAVLIILEKAMLEPARQAFSYGDRKIELGLPLYYLWGVALAGLVATIFCAAVATWSQFRASSGGEAH